MATPVTLADHFVLSASPDRVRRMLNDVPGVVGCIPGAAVVADNGDGMYTAAIGVQYGETGVRFTGSVRIVQTAASDVAVRADGQDPLGSVRAQGEIRLVLGEHVADGTPVDLAAEFTFTGILAPLARSATKIIGPQLMKSFARCLATKLAREAGPE